MKVMSDNQNVHFVLKTKEGAELELRADGLLQTQMNNILNNIIKPNIAPVPQHVLTMRGKKRKMSDIVQSGAVIFNPAEVKVENVSNLAKWAEEEVPVFDLTNSTIINEEQEVLAEKLKAEEINDEMINSRTETVLGTVQSKGKTLPLKSTRSFSPMAELLGNDKLQKLYNTNPPAKVEEPGLTPDYYHTGIKYTTTPVGDKPRYRTFYDCPRCNQTGRHYIPKSVPYVHCHNCQSELEVVPATDKGFGHGEKYRDEHGNFFVAKTLHIGNTPVYDKKAGN
jgi:hypothetical protein